MGMIIIKKIKDNVILFSSEAARVNATLIRLGDIYILVDTMLRPKDSIAIRDYLQEHNIALSYIVNTHWHSDHCFGNRILQTPTVKAVAHFLHAQTLLRERNMFKANHQYSDGKELVPPPDQTFVQNCYWHKNAFVCDAGKGSEKGCELIHAPGHSPDMISVYLPEESILIAGDNLLSSGQNSIALPYFFWGDCNELIQSLIFIRNLNPQIIIAGHGDPISSEKLDDDILYLQNMQTAAMEIIRKNPELNTEKLHELLREKLRVAELYPNAEKREIWVPAVHDLNLKRMALER